MSQLFRVDVERRLTTTFYVAGEDKEAAREDAELLAAELGDSEWDDSEDDVWVRATDEIPQPSRWIWTGGPEGEEVSAARWQEMAEETTA